MPIKSVKMKILKNQKMYFFLMSPRSFYTKNRLVCPVVRSTILVICTVSSVVSIINELHKMHKLFDAE